MRYLILILVVTTFTAVVAGECTATLRRGSRGNCVKVLQRAVGTTADGIFGSGTETAVRSFQRRHGLTADGVVGQNTWKKIHGSSSGGGSGSMNTPGAKGSTVVKAVVAKIEASGVFPGTHGFLRRIACVESQDGNHPNTYRRGYNGGIWQVDSIGFRDNFRIPRRIKDGIKQKFGITWSTGSVSWSDLRKPLYSGLAARAYLYLRPGAIPSNLAGQATYWKRYYNTAAGAGTAAKFRQRANTCA